MKNYQQINESIKNLEPCTSFEDGTYYHISIFKDFTKHRDLKRVAIYGYYKSKYRWTDAEAELMYQKSPDSWTSGTGIERLYDWGKGENKIDAGEDGEWHEPQLDHIVPRSRAKAMGWTDKQINHPDNFQVLPAYLNRLLSNLTDEHADEILPLFVGQFSNYKLVKKS